MREEEKLNNKRVRNDKKGSGIKTKQYEDHALGL